MSKETIVVNTGSGSDLETFNKGASDSAAVGRALDQRDRRNREQNRAADWVAESRAQADNLAVRTKRADTGTFEIPPTRSRRDALGYYHKRKDEHRQVGLGSRSAADSFGYMTVAYEKPRGKESISSRREDRRSSATHWSDNR